MTSSSDIALIRYACDVLGSKAFDASVVQSKLHCLDDIVSFKAYEDGHHGHAAWVLEDGSTDGSTPVLIPTSLRLYHDVSHVADVWASLAAYATKSDLKQYAAFAIFHDWAFSIQPKWPGESEHISALFMMQNAARFNMDAIEVGNTLIGIEATARHTCDQPCLPRQVQHMLDADLLGLAAPWEKYIHASSRVRHEMNVDTNKWLGGRKAFLEAMLSRKRIFYTEHAREYEDMARSNMVLELASVKNSMEKASS